MLTNVILSILFALRFWTLDDQVKPEVGNEKSMPFYEMQAKIDAKLAKVDVALELTLPISFLNEGTLSFLFSGAAEISELSGKFFKNYQVEAAGPGLSIYHLQFDPGSEDEISLEMRYSLLVPEDHEINRISEDWIELNIDSFWHPVLLSFSRFHYKLTLELDNQYYVLNGENLLAETEKSKSWVIESIFPSLDISFSAAKEFYKKEGEFSVVHSTSESTNLDSLLFYSEDALDFLHEYLDRPEDFVQKRIVVETPRSQIGYARGNYVVLSDLNNKGTVELSSFLAHEFSHFWFSNADPQSQDYWLDESFAEFLAMIYIRKSHGLNAYQKDLEWKLDRIKGDSIALDSYKGRPSHIAMYYKGPVLLHHFEEFVGQEQFRELVKQIVEKNISTNKDLLTFIRNVLGPKAEAKMKELRNMPFD